MLYTTEYSPKATNAIRVINKILLVLFLFSVATNLSTIMYFQGPQYIKEVVDKNMPPIPLPKVKQEIRYVEKQDAVPTWKLIQHLNGRINEEMAKVIAIEVNKAHQKYGLPKKLIIAIMRKESNLDPLARSKNSKGQIMARGLMQVFAKWHPKKMEGVTLEQLYHVDVNTDMGCQIFREYYDESDGDLTETFHKYLSKRASKADAKRYMDEILKWWAVLEMYEYNKEANPTPKEPEKVEEDSH